MQVSLHLHLGCGTSGDAEVSLRLGIAHFCYLSSSILFYGPGAGALRKNRNFLAYSCG